MVMINFKYLISLLFHREYEDLERSHAYLTDLVERQGIPVFTDIEGALHCTGKAIRHVCKLLYEHKVMDSSLHLILKHYICVYLHVEHVRTKVCSWKVFLMVNTNKN